MTAFAEFIAQFDVPCTTKVKKKDIDALETGKPFCPVMFEGVLKKFSPDVPNTMSGRPRLVKIWFLFIYLWLYPLPKEKFQIKFFPSQFFS